MKNVFLSLTFFILALNLLAQEYSPSWGKIKKKSGTVSTTMKIIDADEEQYYVLMYTSKGNVIHTHNNTGKFSSEKKLDFTNSEVFIDNFIHTSTGKFGILNMIDRKAKEWVVFRSEFYKGQFSKPKEIYAHEIKKRTTRNFAGTFMPDRESEHLISMSFDSSKVVFVNMLSDHDDGNEKLAIAVFNDRMELEWSKIQEFEYRDTDLSIKSVNITNNGDVYLAARVTEWNKFLKGDDSVKEVYKLFNISQEKMEMTDVDIGNEFATNQLKILNDPNDPSGILLTGFYTDIDRRVGFKGLFFGKYDGRLISNVRVHELKKEFIQDIVTKRSLKKDKGISALFEINHIVQYSDNSFGFIAEEYTRNTNTFWDPYGVPNNIVRYHSNTILIPRFSSEGELLNITKVLKFFDSQDYSESSYAYALSNDRIYLVYNDLPNFNSNRYNTDLCVIGIDGEILYNNTIFDSRELSLNFIPRINFYNDERLLIMKSMAKKYAVGTINLFDPRFDF